MPVYDCGDPDCGECRRAFPDRTVAIAGYKRRMAATAAQVLSPADIRRRALLEAAEIAGSFDNCGTDADPQHAIPFEIVRAIRAAASVQ